MPRGSNRLGQPMSSLPSIPPSASARPVATRDGLVVGIASPMPPVPYVGMLGDPAQDAAAAMVMPLLRAGGHVPPHPTRVRIDGRPLATLAMQALSATGPATTISGSMLARLAGLPIACATDPSQVSPTSAMAVLGGTQVHVRLGGPPTMFGLVGATALVAQAATMIPARIDFADAASAAQRMLSRVSPARRSSLAPPESAVLVGDPVDVATGAVVTAAIDFECVAPPMVLRRSYASNRSARVGAFGRGWSHAFEQSIWLEPGRVVLQDEHGREIEFDTLGLPGGVAHPGDVLRDPTGVLELHCQGRLRYELRDRGRIRQFKPLAGESGTDKDRGLSRLSRIVRTHELTLELTYDDRARLQRISAGDRTMLVFEHDETDHVSSLWSPLGERLRCIARYRYSDTGELVAALDACERETNYEYRGHLLVRETNRDGGSFYYGYDGFGPQARCIRTWGGDGYLDRALSYDEGSVAVTDSLGNITTYHIDPTGVIARITDPLGDVTAYGYDDALRLVSITHPDGTKVVDAYDARGNLIKRKLRGGATWRMAYDEHDNLVEGWDPAGGHWRFAHDGRGLLTRVEDPLGHLVRLEYDGGRLARVIDPLGQITEIDLDGDANATRVALPGRTALHFAYDALGRLAFVRTPADDRIVWSYDELGRPCEVASSRAAVRFERSAEGDVLAIASGDDGWTIARDAFGEITAVRRGDVEVSYARDSEGRIATVRDGSGEVLLSILRDARGLVSAWSARGGDPCLVQHRRGTALVERIVEDGVVTELTWDAEDRLVAIERSDGGAARFQYRSDGLLVAASNQVASWTFERDVRGAVIRQRSGELCLESLALDHLGRRHGLDLGDRVHLSYLRAVTGEVERVAAVAGSVWDLEVERDGHAGIERVRCDRKLLEVHRDPWHGIRAAQRLGGDGHLTAWSPPRTAATAELDDGPRDALHRLVRDTSGASIVYDEDRLLVRGELVRIEHPDTRLPLGQIEGDRIELVFPEPQRVSLSPAVARAAGWHDACFPLASSDEEIAAGGPSPVGLLREAFAYRVYDPEIRPLGGRFPWNPDRWAAEPGEQARPEGRLDPVGIAGIFGGNFPTAGLVPIRLADPVPPRLP